MELINENYLTALIEKIMRRLFPKVEEDLTGRTMGIDEFRKKYCGGKSPEWVRTFIFDRYPEVDFENGGWCVNPRRTERGSKTIIFAKPASKWMGEHDQEIDWNEKFAK